MTAAGRLRWPWMRAVAGDPSRPRDGSASTPQSIPTLYASYSSHHPLSQPRVSQFTPKYSCPLPLSQKSHMPRPRAPV